MIRPYSMVASVLLGMLVHSTSVHAFANYLLSRSQCFTELSTDEAIMNAMVIAASDSVDPSMHIEVVATADDVSILPSPKDPFQFQVLPASLPCTLSLRVVSSNPTTVGDYQWVMDVLTSDDHVGAASFVHGACEGHRRVAGRGAREAAHLRLFGNASTRVVAAWAATYGPVMLTPALRIRVRGGNVRGGAPGIEAPAVNEITSRRWILFALLLLLVLGGWWWCRLQLRFNKGRRWHL